MTRQVVIALVAALLVIAGFAPAVAAAGNGGVAQTDAADVRSPAGGDLDAADENETANESQQETTLTLLSYNDIQTAAAKDGNLPRMATVIEQRRGAHDNPVLVMGAGDQLSPHALSPVSGWRAPVDVLNEIGTDVDTIGNHDLDYGTDGFAAASEASNFPWVATNLINQTTGEPIEGAQRYAVLERGDVRVGVVGVTHPATDSSVAADLAAQNIAVEPTVPTVRQYERVLRNQENADVVVVLMHDGVPKAQEVARKTGVDVVLTAHDEVVYGPEVVDGTIVSEAKARAEYVGEINLTVEGGEVTAMDGRMIQVTEDVSKDEAVSGIINDYRAEVSLDSAAATSEVALDSRFATNYHRESNYGNLITDAMRAQTGADVAITNAGGIRSNAVYGPGEITGGDVFNTLPFSNTVVVVELTGAELRETLESQLVTLDSPVGQQFGAEISQQVSGVSFEWAPHSSAREPLIRDVYVGGEPLDPEATYSVAVNSFIAGGGSGYPLADEPRLNETGKLLATTVIDYMRDQGTVAPQVEGRMRRVTESTHAGTLRLDGEGLSIVRVSLPPTAADVNESSWRASSPGTTDAVEPVFSYRRHSTGKVWLFFQDGALSDLAEAGNGDVDFYVDYTDSRYADQWVYWSNAVYGVDVDVRRTASPSVSASAAVTSPDAVEEVTRGQRLHAAG